MLTKLAVLSPLLAQFSGNFRTWSIGQWGIAIVLIAAVIAIVVVALRFFEVAIPPWAVRVFWIIIVAAVCIGAIRILMSM